MIVCSLVLFSSAATDWIGVLQAVGIVRSDDQCRATITNVLWLSYTGYFARVTPFVFTFMVRMTNAMS
jgi:hypothetical protein